MTVIIITRVGDISVHEKLLIHYGATSAHHIKSFRGDHYQSLREKHYHEAGTNLFVSLPPPRNRRSLVNTSVLPGAVVAGDKLFNAKSFYIGRPFSG